MLYQRYKIKPLNTIEFLDTFAFINSTHWQSSEILILLCKYYIVISDKLVGSFLDMLFLLLAVILSELHEKTKKKRLSYRKKCIEECVWGISLFWLHALFSMSFCCVLRLLPPASQVKHLWNGCYKDTYIAVSGILWDNIMSKRSKMWKSII